MIVTRVAENCLWCYSKSEWEKTSNLMLANISTFTEQGRAIMRRFISPAVEVEIDKAGRLLIPQTLREVSNISKEIVICSMATYFEIWSKEEFDKYEGESASEPNLNVQKALEENLSFIKMR